jgi:hypothetical protein
MVAGLLLQAIGYAWIAMILSTDVSYAELGVAFTVTGAGTSLCFPTVANAVMGSVPLKEGGVASGTSSSLRELGGVVGVSVLASVFARHGVYASPQQFIDGFAPAVWVAVGFSAFGIVPALLAGGSRGGAAAPAVAEAEPVVAAA